MSSTWMVTATRLVRTGLSGEERAAENNQVDKLAVPVLPTTDTMWISRVLLVLRPTCARLSLSRRPNIPIVHWLNTILFKHVSNWFYNAFTGHKNEESCKK